MTHRTLLTTPFGFVVELETPGHYHAEQPYEIFLNGQYHSSGNTRLLCLFGLTPGTYYDVELRGNGEPLCFAMTTQSAGFVIDIRDYNAAGDGINDDTAAINTAIYTAHAGAVVRIPRGIYLVSHIFLKSNVDLYIEEGAELRQDSRREQLAVLPGYQKNYHHTDAVVNASWEGSPLDCYGSLIYGMEAENVRLYGPGVLNGSGREGGWWENPKQKRTAWRPRNLFLNRCHKITVAGLTSRNSAAWNIHPFYSDNLHFYGLTVQSDPSSPNTDGLNPESCRGVEIVGCRFQVGDDCIAVKSGKRFMSRNHLRPCRDIHIRGCWMQEGHGGVVIGSEISCGVQHVQVERCLMENTHRGLRIKTRRGRGDTSVVDGVCCTDIIMRGVSHCIVVNMFYHCDPDGHSAYVSAKEPLPVTDETPSIRNICLDGIDAKEIGGSILFLYGLPESPIENVAITGSCFSLHPDRPVECPAMMDEPVLIPDLGLFAKNIRCLSLEGLQVRGPSVNLVEGERVEL